MSTENILIRPATREDVAPVALLEQQCFSCPWSEQSLGELLNNSFSIFLVAEEEGALLGYVSANCSFETGYINNLAVAPAHRRQGIGKMLLDALEEQALRRDVQTLTLEVRPSNLPARRLYKQLGYEEIGRRPGFYQQPTEDALLLERRLNNPS